MRKAKRISKRAKSYVELKKMCSEVLNLRLDMNICLSEKRMIRGILWNRTKK